MICLGFDNAAKDAAITRYVADNDIRHVVLISPARMRFACSATSHEHVEWAEVILYKFYYRLLQEIDGRTLIVLNECLRTQNRYDLTYNCIRNYLNQTKHQIVFQYLPIVDTTDDLSILVDLDTRSRWRRDPLRREMLSDVTLHIQETVPALAPIDVATDARTRAAYAKEKRALIDGIGSRDPHTIPRNLYLVGGKARLAAVDAGARYVGRNNRFALENLVTYRDVADTCERTVFEFCHNFIDMSDFLAVTRLRRLPAIVTDLKVDRWYLSRYEAWTGRLRDAYAILRQ